MESFDFNLPFLLLPLVYLPQERLEHCLNRLAGVSFDGARYFLVALALELLKHALEVDVVVEGFDLGYVGWIFFSVVFLVTEPDVYWQKLICK